MNISPLHGVVGGALVTSVLVAFALRPAALAPHPAPSPSETVDAPARETAPRAALPVPRVALVYVAGAVEHPGVYALPATARAMDAVSKAGGLLRDADGIAVNLAAHVADGDEIVVPRIGETVAAAEVSPRSDRHSSHRARRGHRRRPAVEAGGAIDLNTADATALATIPGIGATLAARIVAFRAINGRFVSVDGLADVAGITPSRFDAIAPLLTVGSP